MRCGPWQSAGKIECGTEFDSDGLTVAKLEMKIYCYRLNFRLLSFSRRYSCISTCWSEREWAGVSGSEREWAGVSGSEHENRQKNDKHRICYINCSDYTLYRSSHLINGIYIVRSLSFYSSMILRRTITFMLVLNPILQHITHSQH